MKLKGEIKVKSPMLSLTSAPSLSEYYGARTI